MGMRTTVSVIIPVYNAEKTLPKCLESLLENTYQDFEIIAINDGSSDGSMKVLEEYRERYPDKVRVFSQENHGVARTRNAGIGYAGSEYVMFVDNDDYVDNDYIGRFVAEAERGGFDMVIGGYRRTAGKEVLYEMNLSDTIWSKYMVMAPWAKMYRKDFLTGSRIEFLDNNIGEDVYFNLQAINRTDKISIIDYCGYNWFYNEVSVSNTSQKTLESGMRVIPLLDACYEKMREIGVIGNDEVEFYFTRYVVWYLLFIGRGSDSVRMITESVHVFNWLQEHFSGFQKNPNVSLFRPKGETLKNRIIVYFFMMIRRIGLSPVFFRIYCKG